MISFQQNNGSSRRQIDTQPPPFVNEFFRIHTDIYRHAVSVKWLSWVQDDTGWVTDAVYDISHAIVRTARHTGWKWWMSWSLTYFGSLVNTLVYIFVFFSFFELVLGSFCVGFFESYWSHTEFCMKLLWVTHIDRLRVRLRVWRHVTTCPRFKFSVLKAHYYWFIIGWSMHNTAECIGLHPAFSCITLRYNCTS